MDAQPTSIFVPVLPPQLIIPKVRPHMRIVENTPYIVCAYELDQPISQLYAVDLAVAGLTPGEFRIRILCTDVDGFVHDDVFLIGFKMEEGTAYHSISATNNMMMKETIPFTLILSNPNQPVSDPVVQVHLFLENMVGDVLHHITSNPMVLTNPYPKLLIEQVDISPTKKVLVHCLQDNARSEKLLHDSDRDSNLRIHTESIENRPRAEFSNQSTQIGGHDEDNNPNRCSLPSHSSNHPHVGKYTSNTSTDCSSRRSSTSSPESIKMVEQKLNMVKPSEEREKDRGRGNSTPSPSHYSSDKSNSNVSSPKQSAPNTDKEKPNNGTALVNPVSTQSVTTVSSAKKQVPRSKEEADEEKHT